jgi:protease-4
MSNAPESAGAAPGGAPPPAEGTSTAGPPSGPGELSPLPSLSPPPAASSVLGCAFALSFACNLVLGLVLLVGAFLMLKKSDAASLPLTEQHYVGKSGAADKVAVIALDGIILEGLLGYVHKQINQAASDKHVKAVVVRINSPGGSITASDDLYHRLWELRYGNAKKDCVGKPLLVSMGSMAASGGYYVAMPGQVLFAEHTTMTGSIGVYAAFPNIKKLADDHGITVNTIKQGQIKHSGSPFADMTEHERQVWQDTIDESYQRFIQVVEKGRPALAGGKLLAPVTVTPVDAGPDFLKKGNKPEPYTRYLADGGIWTAEKALQYKLIDRIGTLDDAILAAHDMAGLGEHYQAIKYLRPSPLAELLGLGDLFNSSPSGTLLDPKRLEAGFTPRLWYLAPGAEVSGFLAATRKREEQP